MAKIKLKFVNVILSVVITLLVVPLVSEARGAVHVNGYYRSNGTYVQPHYRSAPDGNPYNNWSYPGNTNPYTGEMAGGNPDTYLKNYYDKSSGSSYSSPSYSLPSYSDQPPSVSVGSTHETVTGGYKSYGVLFCNIGYYENSGSCMRVPDNGLSYGGVTFYCNAGYSKSGDTCVKDIPTCMVNASYTNGGCYCNDGFSNFNNSCIAYDSYCQLKFGSDYYYLGGNSCTRRTPSCQSNATYNFAKEGCVCNEGFTSLNSSCISSDSYCKLTNGSDYSYVNDSCKKIVNIKSYLKNMVDYLPNQSCSSFGFVSKDDLRICNFYKKNKPNVGIYWSVLSQDSKISPSSDDLPKVTKDAVIGNQSQESSLRKFLKKYPQYEVHQDPEGILYNKLLRQAYEYHGGYNGGSPNSSYYRSLECAHEDISNHGGDTRWRNYRCQ